MSSYKEQARLLRGKVLKELSKLDTRDQVTILDNIIDSIRTYKKEKDAAMELTETLIEELGSEI